MRALFPVLMALTVYLTVAFAHAAPAQPSGAKAVTASSVQKMVSEYRSGLPARNDFRVPFLTTGFRDHSSCVDEACAKMGCNFESDTLEVARACAGNYGGGCVRAACSKFSCSFKSDVLDVIAACRENYGGECVKVACDKSGCAFKSDVIDFANACQGADGDCVKSVCDRTGCNFKSETLEAIRACKGN